MQRVWSQLNWLEAGFFVAVLCVAWFGSWALSAFLASRLRKLRERGAPVVSAEVLASLVPLIRYGLMVVALAVGIRFFDLPRPVEKWLGVLLQATFTLLVALVASAAVRVAIKHWATKPSDPAETRTRATFAPVLARASSIFLLTIAALLILQNGGYNVAGLLAGLGIGGLAVALAAKETLANLFGSIAVLLDRTFQVGDVIRQGDITGTVVKIGLRSTRVRTSEGYIVSIPNQIITNAPVTNMGPPSGMKEDLRSRA